MNQFFSQNQDGNISLLSSLSFLTTNRLLQSLDIILIKLVISVLRHNAYKQCDKNIYAINSQWKLYQYAQHLLLD